MSSAWIQWILVPLFAGVGGVFGLLTYVHGTFVSQDHMAVHVKQPHKNSISVERYSSDLQYLRKQITEINRKLDTALLRR